MVRTGLASLLARHALSSGEKVHQEGHAVLKSMLETDSLARSLESKPGLSRA